MVVGVRWGGWRTGYWVRSQQQRSKSNVLVLASTITVSKVGEIGVPVLLACGASVGVVGVLKDGAIVAHIRIF